MWYLLQVIASSDTMSTQLTEHCLQMSIQTSYVVTLLTAVLMNMWQVVICDE